MLRASDPLNLETDTDPVSKMLSALEYYAMDEVQNFNNPEYCTSSEDPIRIAEYKYSPNVTYRLRKTY
jgi:hypothetical protein